MKHCFCLSFHRNNYPYRGDTLKKSDGKYYKYDVYIADFTKVLVLAV